MTRSTLLRLAFAIVTTLLANCARVDPITLKNGKAHGPQWGDPIDGSAKGGMISGESSYQFAPFFSML